VDLWPTKVKCGQAAAEIIAAEIIAADIIVADIVKLLRTSYQGKVREQMNHAKPNAARDLVVFLFLIAFGVVGRFVWLDVPNFSPLAATALFAGFYFRHLPRAMLVPISVLVISNYWLPLYNSTGEMVAVYAAMLFPVVLSLVLHGKLSLLRLGVCSVLPSAMFFVVSNFAVWACNNWYAHTWAGLVQCYTSAIPFYRYMLAGDLIFTWGLFGLYVAGSCLVALRRCSPSAL